MKAALCAAWLWRIRQSCIFQFVEQIGASPKMLLMFLLLAKSLGHVLSNRMMVANDGEGFHLILTVKRL